MKIEFEKDFKKLSIEMESATTSEMKDLFMTFAGLIWPEMSKP